MSLKDSYNASIHLIELAEIDQAPELAKALVVHHQKNNTNRVVWLAPQIPDCKPLEKAEKIISSSECIYAVVYYPMLFEHLLQKAAQITEQRQLLFPFEKQTWVSMEALAKGIEQVANNTVVFIKGKTYNNNIIAREVTKALDAIKKKDNFLRAQFRKMDLNADGLLSAEEIHFFLKKIGFSLTEVTTILEAADTNKDGVIEYKEFANNLSGNLETMLSFIDTEVKFVQTSERQHQEILMVTPEVSRYEASQMVKGMTSPSLPKEARILEVGDIGEEAFEEWIEKQALTFLGTGIIPGKGLYFRRLSQQNSVPAIKATIIYPDGRHMSIIRSANETTVYWEGFQSSETTTEISFSSETFSYILHLENEKLRKINLKGQWPGMPEAMGLIINETPIKKWQQSALNELGTLHIEDQLVTSPDRLICNCLQLCVKDFTPHITNGDNQIETIVEATQATSVCGGCEPLVEELCGLSNMAVATIVEKKPTENKDIQCISIKPVDQELEPFQPGQHLVLQAYIQNQWITRAYSLISPAGRVNETYEIAVKREELGVFSRWINDHGDSSSILQISIPKGSYFLENKHREIVFFAAGIGVTPAISMLRTLTQNQDTRNFILEWSAPYSKNFILNEEFDFYAKQKNIIIQRRATKTEGRISSNYIKENYTYQDGKVAFLCGPETYMEKISQILLECGWPLESIKTEKFNASINQEGQLETKEVSQSKGCSQALNKELEFIESDSFFLQPVANLKEEARLFLSQFYAEKNLSKDALDERLNEVMVSIEETGTYEHTIDELTFASRVAWRNSTRCVGRYFWGNMIVRDCREIDNEKAVFESLVDHLRLGINEGNLRAVISIFNPNNPQIRLYNPLLLMFAGYKQPDGSVLGDPATVELTKIACDLGWKPKGEKSRFDPLPLIVEIDGRKPQYFDWPDDLVKTVPITHPDFTWFKDLKLEWFMVPAVSGLALDAGGIQYRCAPSNGFFISTEVGARDLGDVSRYNMLPVIAEKMGLDMSSDETHWKDRAIIELNLAVQWSYRKHQVRMLDHHTIVDYFMKFHGQEIEAGRSIHADWKWIVPPISGSAVEAFHMDMVNKIIKPNYYYQEDPWKSNDWRVYSKV